MACETLRSNGDFMKNKPVLSPEEKMQIQRLNMMLRSKFSAKNTMREIGIVSASVKLLENVQAREITRTLSAIRTNN
jgi:hypothetical protein